MSSRSSHPNFQLYFQTMLTDSQPEAEQPAEPCPDRPVLHAVFRDMLIRGLPLTGSEIWLGGIRAARAPKKRSGSN
ncbi:hypothetical protein [Neorhizobium galegae]|uniref:hypothetical protein n=1 Tax=Neorhizobium galegae TaxID=399 RepID=UPI000621E04E|nr:hypothetical protein [Neorhizobium galegae]CDZ28522.1 Hypothetical protein NGAL_HAMBI490_33820 [Neorhizobium galegae bv. officinalis]KAA9386022.1 hypothetical protein F4V88_05820 [Neorhizobium galegae]KAB1113536.1 hypothetical protein F4V89_12550 [Neorhizobium galegae]MCM2496501.1 hypothetical protein [Neorhizobium galegae]MCQ1770346.1 hypothetical protein [Neorhizobium galegae]